MRSLLLPLCLSGCCAALTAAQPTPQGPETPLSATRAEIVLNGAWRFQPVADPNRKQPSNDWGTIQVPGSWFPQKPAIPGLLERGKSPLWSRIDESTTSAWYERAIEIPAAWAGREIEVDFDRVSTDALVFLDGQQVGKLEWPGGNVNLTRAAKPGKTQTLRLQVVATPDVADFTYMGIGQNTSSKATLEARGITGDVTLACRPGGSWISGVFIETSVRKKQLKLTVEWGGKAPASALACEVVARSWPGGEERKRWTVELPAGAVSSVDCPWESPALWDYKQPNLHTLTVTVKAAGIADEITERFGFREWRVDGRTLLLNELPFRPQPVNLDKGHGNPRVIGAMLDLHLSRGIGLGWQWPEPFYQRGRLFHQRAIATAADEKGFPLFGNLCRLNEFVNNPAYELIWPQNKQRWEKLTAREWRKFRNHPSITGWLLSGNLGPHHADQDPRHIGRSKWHSSEITGILEGARAFMRGLDPGRTVLFGAASWPGDIYSAMTYLNFIPLQEREEWLDEWAKAGTMPYIAIEFGTPLQNSYMRGRNHFARSGETEPWMAEFAAIHLGRDAYSDGADYRRNIRANYQGGRKFKSFNFDNAMTGDPVYQKIQDLFIRNSWRSWRSHDAGWVGMLSWSDMFNLPPIRSNAQVNLLAEFKPGMRGAFPPSVPAWDIASAYQDGVTHSLRPGGVQLLEQGRATLAWIAGPPEAFTSKQHNYRPGAVVIKQAAIVNDTRETLACSATWTLSVGGKQTAHGELSGTALPGSSVMLPFSATLPADSPAAVTDGRIELRAKVGAFTHTDVFDFRVFPAEPESAPPAAPVLIADSAGMTSAWLSSIGVKSQPWNGEAAPGAVLVIGRQTLSGDARKRPQWSALEEFAASGGRLLIMSQDADWLRQNLGFRVTRHSTRRMWPLHGDHPLMQGIPVAALRDWAGTSTLHEARPAYPMDAFPPYGWRWGQRGVLGAAVIEKPHFSGWRPLFESEFDLQYAPVMELDFGKGRVTWCSLDLEDQSAPDPAAEKLGRNLLRHVANAALVPRATKAIYLGGATGADFLTSIGMDFERRTAIDPAAPLWVVAPDADISPQAVWSHVERGGRIFFLGRPQPGTDRFGVKTELAADFRGCTNPPAAPEFAGLGAGDLRLKTDLAWPVLAASGLPGFQPLADGMLGLRRHGKGVAVCAQLGPDLLLAGHKELPEYLRINRWRQCRAICQILANLGARFEADSRIFRPRIERIPLTGPWQVRITRELPGVDWKNQHPDPGISPEAMALVAPQAPGTADADWQTFNLPGWYPPFETSCGEAVWKLDVAIPPEWAGKFVQVNIPGIKSYDTVFWNGKPVGSTAKDSQKQDPWDLPRKYRVPGDLVHAGTNTLAIRQFAPDRQGGIHGKTSGFFLRLLSGERQAAPLYHSDYREEFDTGDEPYRYLRW